MKKFAKIVNSISLAISAITVIALLVVVALFSTSPDLKTNETQLVVEDVTITKKVADKSTSYYASNVDDDLRFLVVLGYSLYDLEQNPIHLTIQNQENDYIVNINDRGIATVVYQKRSL